MPLKRVRLSTLSISQSESPPVQLSAVLTCTAAAHTYKTLYPASPLEEETLKHFIT